jgi:hypothetical protein
LPPKRGKKFRSNRSSRCLESNQPLSCILHLSYPWVSVLPEGEEFLVMLYGFGCVSILRFKKHLLPCSNLTLHLI